LLLLPAAAEQYSRMLEAKQMGSAPINLPTQGETGRGFAIMRAG